MKPNISGQNKLSQFLTAEIHGTATCKQFVYTAWEKQHKCASFFMFPDVAIYIHCEHIIHRNQTSIAHELRA
jgi:hypothetical protein